MTVDMARAVADAVLFEGYLLYPYRASALKNRMRWQFGVLAPPGDSSEPWYSHTECLVESDADPVLELRTRFLQLRARNGGLASDEGVVREVETSVHLDRIGEEREVPFELAGGEETENATTCRTWPLSGVIRLGVQRIEELAGLRRVRITVENHTRWDRGDSAGREDMLRRSLVSAHTLLAVRGGEFVSLLEPPERAHDAAKSCRNVHTWPVLVGEHDRRDVMLSSPIILYDYPAVAAESPGDLFDAGEIDEILTLRTMTLTDEEKQEARATDARAAEIIDRTENLPDEVLERLHGSARRLHGDGR